MSETPIRPTEIKYLATEAGVTRAPERDDLANEFLRAHRSRPHEHALDDFAEEAPAAPPTAPVAAARSHGPAVPAPADGSREFAWPPENEAWTPVEHVPPVTPRRRSATRWASEFIPIAAIVTVFLLIVTSVGVWMARDVRTTRAAREDAVAPTRDVPPLEPRPLSWAEAAAQADSGVLPSRSEVAATAAPAEPPTASTAASPATPPARTPAVIPEKPAAPRSSGAVAAPERAAQTTVARPPRGDVAAPRTRVPSPAPPSVSPSIASPPRPQASGGAVPPPATASVSSPPAVTLAPPIAHLEESPVVPTAAAANEPPPTTVSRPPTGAAAALAAPAATVGKTDEDDIRRVLGAYRSAYSELDPYAAQTVWPTVNVKALSRAFDQLSSQTLEFKQCRVSVSSATASATCDGTASYVPKVGSRSERTEPRRLRFDLHKGSEGWTIDSVSTR